MVKLFTSADGKGIETLGLKMAKKRNPVFLRRQTEPFQVQTNEGKLSGNAGDYVAYDPLSGHVWPVSKEYVQLHYEDF